MKAIKRVTIPQTLFDMWRNVLLGKTNVALPLASEKLQLGPVSTERLFVAERHWRCAWEQQVEVLRKNAESWLWLRLVKTMILHG